MIFLLDYGARDTGDKRSGGMLGDLGAPGNRAAGLPDIAAG